MITTAILVLAAFLTSCSPAVTLERQDRQDTIYEVRGEPNALKAFDEQIGESWTGGVVLDGDASDGTLSYWAYSDRTAAEARALMMPAIMSGLQLSPEEYSEAKQFPADRGKLDQVAAKCGVKSDPFFITPKKSVEMTLAGEADAMLAKCLSDGVRIQTGLPITAPRRDEEKN